MIGIILSFSISCVDADWSFELIPYESSSTARRFRTRYSPEFAKGLVLFKSLSSRFDEASKLFLQFG
jgi:hypothetical protein